MLLILWLFQTADNDAIHITMGGAVLSLIGAKVWDSFSERRRSKNASNGNGNGYSIKRCGTEDLIYWERMKDNVTRPICDAIERAKK